MARPTTYTDETEVYINTRMAISRPQTGGSRRAVIDAIINNGGRATIGYLNELFGFDTKPIVTSLTRSSWLHMEEAE